MIALRRHDLGSAAALIGRTFEGTSSAQADMPIADLHHTAYEVFRATGDDRKALVHLEAFKRLDDEKRSLAASTNAALMSARFDFANQNAKITRLHAEQAERDAQARVRLHTYLTIGLLSAATIVSTLLTIGFVSIRRSRNQVRAANETLSATNAALEKALAAKTEFLATTSHEIRTPLNGILGMTQVILADRTIAPSLRGRVELVHGAGETMRALVDDILDLAKMETGEFRIFPAEMNLRRLLTDAAQVWAGQAETKGIAIELDLTGGPDGILADEVRLRQVVFNLMSNAIKFTDRGKVRLFAAAEPDEAGERLLIRVEDTGIGVPADRLDDIFESFQQVDGGTTRRHGGTGLGLAICRNLARAMGGEMRVQSTLGAGSCFTIELPLIRTVVPAAATRTRAKAAGLADAAMLLVEPNPLAQGMLRALLGSQIASLQFVADETTALAAIAAGGIDHVVADGTALGLQIDAAGRIAGAAGAAGARATILWPAPDAATGAALAERGVTHLVAKPISAPDLLAALKMGYGSDVASRDIAA